MTTNFKRIAPFLSLGLFLGALWFLYRTISHYHYHQVMASFGQIPLSSILFSVGFMILSYVIFVGYDWLGLKYIDHPLPLKKVVVASYLGNAFTNGLGHSLLFGGPVRYRFYTTAGLSSIEITKLILFCTFTLHLGFMMIAGTCFLVTSLQYPFFVPHWFPGIHWVGLALILIVILYLGSSLRDMQLIKIGNFEFNPPTIDIAIQQIMVSSLDWLFCGVSFYFLLPHHSSLSFLLFLSIFLLAQILGLVSQVPAGLGVFESIITSFLLPFITGHELLASLIAFRLIYYVLPLATAVMLLAIYEILEKKYLLKQWSIFFTEQIRIYVPLFLSVTTFIGGAILLFSGATPAVRERFHWMQKFLPLPIIEISHFFGSLVGVGLLVLSRGISRRLDAAYWGTAVLLCFGVIFSILKGLDFEEATILSMMLIALVASRENFYRKSPLFEHAFERSWWFSIILVVAASIWVGLFVFKHVDYSNDLWWQFTFHGHAPRFLRASVGAGVLLVILGLTQLVKPVTPVTMLPTPDELEKIKDIVGKSKYTYANLALLGDKSFLLNSQGTGFIMYAIQKYSWIAMGDPVCPPDQMNELVWQFREISEDQDSTPCFYQVSPENLSHYVDAGFTFVKIGEEGIIALEQFSLEGSNRKELRHIVNKLSKEGCSFECVPKDQVPLILEKIRQISDEWLAHKKTREKGFSLGSFKEDYLKTCPIGVVRIQEEIVAFANIWSSTEKEELSIDLMRYSSSAPPSVMDYLFIQIMLWGKEQGYKQFNLGMAPLAGLEQRSSASFWNRVASLVFRHGENFYNFQGLRNYKDKFDPVWVPRYIAAPGRAALPSILANITTLISGGMKGLVKK